MPHTGVFGCATGYGLLRPSPDFSGPRLVFLLVSPFRLLMVCTRCGIIGADAREFRTHIAKIRCRMTRRFPALWSARELEQAFVVSHAKGQAVAYTHFRRDENEARQANVLTHDEGGKRNFGPREPLWITRALMKRDGGSVAPRNLHFGCQLVAGITQPDNGLAFNALVAGRSVERDPPYIPVYLASQSTAQHRACSRKGFASARGLGMISGASFKLGEKTQTGSGLSIAHVTSMPMNIGVNHCS